MNNKTKIIITAVVVLIAALGIFLPILLNPSDDSQKTVTIEIVCARLEIKQSYTITTKQGTVDKLLQDETEKLKPVINISGYLDTIGGLTLNSNEFVCVYTSDEAYADKNDVYNPVYVSTKGTSCWSALVGIAQLPVKDGAVYAFVILSW